MPFQTQLQADLLGWRNALKAVGKTSDLEVVVLNAEKGKFLKLSIYDTLIRNNGELFLSNTKNNSAIV